MLDEYAPVTIADFKGLWDTGNDDSCPAEHFLSARNVRYGTNEVFTREGSILDSTVPNVVRAHLYKRIDEATRVIILNSSGQFFDSLHPESPILVIPEAIDFSMVNFYNRAYISPHNGQEGLPNTKIHVYDGTTMYLAGGDIPLSLTATVATISGVVSPSYHFFAVSYETSTGFITKPGPATSLLCPGDKAVDLVIPTGPPGTLKRHILTTEGIPVDQFIDNALAWEFFRLQVVENNVDTAITVNFYDTELIESVDYLFDQLDRIPAGVVLTQYAGRLVVGGADGENSTIRISRKYEPESFDAVSGFCICDPTEAGGIKAAVEFRESLYIFKSYRAYATADDGRNAPALWNVITIDKGAGTEPFGISTILDAKGTTTDRFLIADRSGLLLYDGFFHRPELTWKVSKFWNRLDKETFHKIQVLNDPVSKSIYVLCNRLPGSYPDSILYGNYDDGLAPESIKWSVWTTQTGEFRTGYVDVDFTKNTLLFIGNALGILEFNSDQGDHTFPIESWVETGKIRLGRSGHVCHFNGIRLRIVGVGTLGTSIFSEDNVQNKALRNIDIELFPGKEKMQWCNFVNEQASIRFSMNGLDDKFNLYRITVFCKILWDQRRVV